MALVKDGQEIIGQFKEFRPPDPLDIGYNVPNYLTVTFDLNGCTLGAWDLVVKNPGDKIDSMAGAFEVIGSTLPAVTIDITGRDVFRPDTKTVFYFTLRNLGNVDAPGVLSVSGIPPDAENHWDLLSPAWVFGPITGTIKYFKDGNMLVLLPKMVIPPESPVIIRLILFLKVPENRLIHMKAYWEQY